MKKMNFKNILFSAALAAGAMSLASCSLEEENPGGFTMGEEFIEALFVHENEE